MSTQEKEKVIRVGSRKSEVSYVHICICKCLNMCIRFTQLSFEFQSGIYVHPPRACSLYASFSVSLPFRLASHIYARPRLVARLKNTAAAACCC